MSEEPFLPPLSTEVDGLTIRSWQAGDGSTLAEVGNASFEHLRPWMPWASDSDTPEEAEARVRQFAGAYLCNQDFVLSVWEGDTLIGGTGFHLRSGPIKHRNAEIGMWVRGDRAGQGYGTRILRAMVDWGFGEWGWERLVWVCETENKASSRTAEKAGLTLEATLREDRLNTAGEHASSEIWAIIPDDLTS